MTKYTVKYTSMFRKNLKKLTKQGKDINKLFKLIERIANRETLESYYKVHRLFDNKYYNNCYECHIEPDWLLVYKYDEDNLLVLLVNSGTHSELFN